MAFYLPDTIGLHVNSVVLMRVATPAQVVVTGYKIVSSCASAAASTTVSSTVFITALCRFIKMISAMSGVKMSILTKQRSSEGCIYAYKTIFVMSSARRTWQDINLLSLPDGSANPPAIEWACHRIQIALLKYTRATKQMKSWQQMWFRLA